MKKIILALLYLVFMTNTFATVDASRPTLKASEIFFSVATTGIKISLLELSQIKIKDVEQLTGNKMNFGDRIKFTVAQKKLRGYIAPDGFIDAKALNKAFNKYQKREEGSFNIGGFALGFLLGPIGVLIAYLINDDNKQSRVRSAWKGFLAALVIALAIFAAGGGF